jgi:hypothetical protein
MGSSSARGSGLEQILYAPKGVMSGLKTLAWWLFPRDPITGAYLPPEQAPWYMPMQPYEGLLPGQQPIPPEFTQSLQNIMDLQRWLSSAQNVVGPLGQATNILGTAGAIGHMTDVLRPAPSISATPTSTVASTGGPLASIAAPLGRVEDFLGMTAQMAQEGAGMAKRGMGFLEQAAGALFPIAHGSLTRGLEQAAERYYESLKPLLERDIAQTLEAAGLGGARYSSGAQRALSEVGQEFYSNFMKNLMQAAQTGAELQTRAALGTPELGRGAAGLAGAMANLGGLGLGAAGIEADIANMLAQTSLGMGRLGLEAGRAGMSGAQTMWEMTGQGLAAPYQEYLRQSYYPMEIMQTLVSALRPRQIKQQSSSSAKGGCCFIFLEAYDGKLPWVVRAYRDQHMTPKNRRGYYRLADKLVPLMRKSKIVKHLVRFLMTKPMTFYGKYFYKLNPWGVLAAPIAAFWLLIFDLMGHKAPYVRSNGEVV